MKPVDIDIWIGFAFAIPMSGVMWAGIWVVVRNI